MSTDRTPIDRAIEAHEETWSGIVAEMSEDAAHGDTPMSEAEMTRRVVLATVSAALTNDTDPAGDPIARTLRKHSVLTVLASGPGCNCGTPWDREVHRAPTFWFAAHQAAAVRAAILGADQ